MSELKENTIPKKALIGIGLIIVLVIIVAVIVSSWKNPETGTYAKNDDSAWHRIDSEDVYSGSHKGGKATGTQKNQDEDQEDKDDEDVDPSLRNVTVTELAVDDPHKEPDDPEKREIKRIIGVMTKPLDESFRNLPSFTYRGEMKMTAPTFTMDEKAYNAGQRYGESIEVTSRFTLQKDEKGNFHIHQEASSSKGNTKFDSKMYNGDLYYVDGKYTFIDANGDVVGEDTLNQVLSNNAHDNSEPLVRRNWIQLIKQMDLVMGFNSSGEDDASQNYVIQDINPDIQKSTMQTNNLSGNISILKDHQIIGEANIEGDGQLKRGYMSGADISYSINMAISDIGSVSSIANPR
jgi:hypothetical protein